MKRYKSLLIYIGSVFLIVLASGCGLSSSSVNSIYGHLFMEETAHLVDDDSSPYCDFSIDYSYLKEADSIAVAVNQTIQREFLGEDYSLLMPEVAVDSFKNAYLRSYREEVGEIYLNEKTQTTTDEEIPAWFNQTYSIVTFLEEGQEGIINATANYFVDTGGAHPNQWSRWLNFDFVTGAMLQKEDVFQLEMRNEIENLLLEKLIHLQTESNPDSEVRSLEDLQELGFFQWTNMYIPDNFLLSKRGVLFLFNRYDIAPYSAGETVIEVPYEEIGHYLKR